MLGGLSWGDAVGLVVVGGLASFRVWWLLARDDVVAGLRGRLPAGVVLWLGCPWCGGFWVSVAVFGLAVFGGVVGRLVVGVFGVAGVAGLLSVLAVRLVEEG